MRNSHSPRAQAYKRAVGDACLSQTRAIAPHLPMEQALQNQDHKIPLDPLIFQTADDTSQTLLEIVGVW
jgi:hypothetical protein